MRKYFALALLLCLLLTGCGSEKATVHTMVLRGDVPIALSAPAEPVLAALGAPFEYGEHSGQTGLEKTYRFAGLGLKTVEADGCERILGMTITDGNILAPDGIAVGDSAKQVYARFGADAFREGYCTVFRNREKLEILLQNGVVTAISYSLQ